jgi:hypothetical protein
MNIYFAYTAGSPDQIYYGKYFGYAANSITERDLITIVYPQMSKCYPSIKNTNDITLSILFTDTTSVFSDRDPFKYKFVYVVGSPNQLYFNGTLMN